MPAFFFFRTLLVERDKVFKDLLVSEISGPAP